MLMLLMLMLLASAVGGRPRHSAARTGHRPVCCPENWKWYTRPSTAVYINMTTYATTINDDDKYNIIIVYVGPDDRRWQHGGEGHAGRFREYEPRSSALFLFFPHAKKWIKFSYSSSLIINCPGRVVRARDHLRRRPTRNEDPIKNINCKSERNIFSNDYCCGSRKKNIFNRSPLRIAFTFAIVTYNRVN